MEDTPPGLNGPLSVRDVGIRSYVVRSGRMTEMQKDSLQRLYPRYGVAWEPGRILDSESLFGVSSPFVVEIGFGMGSATISIAKALPETRFLGLEVHAPGVGKLLSEIEHNKIDTIRVIRHDAIEVVDSMLAPESIDGFNVFFPDPWPKKRHHKRRIMNTSFVTLMASRLKRGGYLYFVTDWEEYAEATLETLTSIPALTNSSERWAQRMPWRPITKFEQRAINDGRPILELLFLKV